MEFSAEGAQAIPLWINGHPFLSVTRDFFDIVDPRTGAAVRRVPLCGEEEAQQAVAAARSAQENWVNEGMAARQGHLLALAEALSGYAGHFAGLLDQELACGEVAAEAEVAQAVLALKSGEVGRGGVVGIVADAQGAFAAALRLATPVLMAGGTLVLKPSPKATGVLYALAELTRRAGWPDGVFNVLTGDLAAVEGLCAAGVDRLACRAKADFAPQLLARTQAAQVQLDLCPLE